MKLRHQGLEQGRKAAIMPAKQLVLRRVVVVGTAKSEDVSVNSQGASPPGRMAQRSACIGGHGRRLSLSLGLH